jgi:MFS family permease
VTLTENRAPPAPLWRRTAPLYLGAFLGPFGATLLSPGIPAIASDLDVSVEVIAASVSAYMTPFALLQLVLPAVTRRIDPRRLVRVAFATYASAAVLCAFSPTVAVFVVALALMGAANAFLSPLLLAALAAVVPQDVLGRAVGTFFAVQTAGFTLGPAYSGLVGEVSWRIVYASVAGLGIPLALSGLAVRSVPSTPGHGRLREVVDRRMLVLGAAAFLGWGTMASIGFVIVLMLDEQFNASSTVVGLVLAGSGVGGMLLGRIAGSACDRLGRPVVALVGAVASAGILFTLPLMPSVPTMAALYLALGAAGAFLWSSLGTIATEISAGDHRAAAISAYNFSRFVGSIFSPILLAALFAWNSRAPFVLASLLGLVVAALTIPWFYWYRSGAIPAQARPVLPTPEVAHTRR